MIDKSNQEKHELEEISGLIEIDQFHKIIRKNGL